MPPEYEIDRVRKKLRLQPISKTISIFKKQEFVGKNKRSVRGGRMKVKTIKVFEFSELDQKTQEKVIDSFREDFYIDIYNEPLEEQFKEIAEEKGFKDVEFCWSLENCQGDGVSFGCKDLDGEHFLKKNKLLSKFGWTLKKDIIFNLNRIDSHYSHKNTINVDWESYEDLTEKQEEQIEELKEIIEKVRCEVCDDCEKEGYKYYEWLLSDENITNHIEINEYEFLEDGRIY